MFLPTFFFFHRVYGRFIVLIQLGSKLITATNWMFNYLVSLFCLISFDPTITYFVQKFFRLGIFYRLHVFTQKVQRIQGIF